jgi:hypothetical protein
MSTSSAKAADAAILITFYSMEEGQLYMLNEDAFSRMNRVRLNHRFDAVADQQAYLFRREENILLINDKKYFDFGAQGKDLAFHLSFSLTFTLSIPIALAFQSGDIELCFKTRG